MDNSNDSEQLTEREEASALRIATRVIEAAAPPDSYWPGYHARLREKLNETREPRVASSNGHGPSWITRVLRTSVSIPVPVAVAVGLFFILALFFVRGSAESTSPEVQVVYVPVEKTVQVPVVQEKVVTRVIYRPTPRRVQQRSVAAQSNSTLAKTLSGFKPTEEVKLTVIKGGGNER